MSNTFSWTVPALGLLALLTSCSGGTRLDANASTDAVPALMNAAQALTTEDQTTMHTPSASSASQAPAELDLAAPAEFETATFALG